MSGDVCGMCKGSGHLPGNPEPIACPQCARRAEAIEAAKRDKYATAAAHLAQVFDEYIHNGNEMRETFAKLQRQQEKATRLLVAGVIEIRNTLKGGK